MNEATINDVYSYVAPPRGPVDAVVTCLRKFFDFRGRASRSEFWWFVLFEAMVGVGLQQMANFLWNSERINYYVGEAVDWGFAVPLLAAAARRLHDAGFSAWFLLLLLPAELVLIARDGWMGPALQAQFEDDLGWWALPFFVALLCLLVLKGKANNNRYDSTQ